jgi:IG-like fold at C-terminal of FixG, putative oxidoreductase
MTNKGTVANYYNLQMINKSFEKVPLELKISGLDHVKMDMIGGQTIVLQPESLTENVFMVEVPENDVRARKNTLKLEIYSNGKLLETEKVSFLGPMK